LKINEDQSVGNGREWAFLDILDISWLLCLKYQTEPRVLQSFATLCLNSGKGMNSW
jgi:hypothetical protein